MNDQLSMFDPPISPGTGNATSSPASEPGVTSSGAPGGPTTGPSGPDRVPASHFRRRAREAGMPTSGICGPLGFGSSRSADLTFALANRYRAQTDSLGSTLYALTWKV